MSQSPRAADYRPPVEEVLLALDVAGRDELPALDALASVPREDDPARSPSH